MGVNCELISWLAKLTFTPGAASSGGAELDLNMPLVRSVCEAVTADFLMTVPVVFPIFLSSVDEGNTRFIFLLARLYLTSLPHHPLQSSH